MMNRVTFSMFMLLALSTPCRADLIIIPPNPGEHNPSARGADGDLVLNSPDPVIYQPAGGIAAQLLQLVLENEFGTSRGWTFTLGPALNGTLNIDRYYATIYAPHIGGTDFFARYNSAPEDEPVDVFKLRWVQLIDTNDPVGPRNPYIDPPVGNLSRDDLPFYYTEQDHAANSFGTNIYGDYDLFFHDRPRRECRSHPDFIFWRSTLFLTTSDNGGAPGNVTLHDGVRWGFDFSCAAVPEPNSGILTAIGLALLSLIVWRRARCDGKLGSDDARA